MVLNVNLIVDVVMFCEYHGDFGYPCILGHFPEDTLYLTLGFSGSLGKNLDVLENQTRDLEIEKFDYLTESESL